MKDLFLPLTFIILWVAGIAGWIMNIIQVIKMADAGFTAMFVLKIVGIFAAPLGAILGWIGV